MVARRRGFALPILRIVVKSHTVLMAANMHPLSPTCVMVDARVNVEYRDLAVIGYPGYRVGDDGSVWSCWRKKGLGRGRGTTHVMCDAWKRLKMQLRKDGHFQVNIANSIRYVHHLVLLAFVGPCPDGMECCHWDGNGANNALSNLRWDTHQANAQDRVRHGTSDQGERNPCAKLTTEQVKGIRLASESSVRLAARYGVSVSEINFIRAHERWKHIPVEEACPPRDTRNLPKLTPAQVEAIRAEYATGSWTQTALGAKYGVSHTVISNIIHRKDWKHVA